MPVIDDNDCIEFGPKSRACVGWPVRIAGMQGLWRYTGVAVGYANGESAYVDVVGPYFPNNPERNGGRSRIIKTELVRYAGKQAKPIDVLHVETTAISDEAKRARRR